MLPILLKQEKDDILEVLLLYYIPVILICLGPTVIIKKNSIFFVHVKLFSCKYQLAGRVGTFSSTLCRAGSVRHQL